MRDPFVVLGVSRSDDMDTINKAYRKLAKQYHPDLHPNDKECAAKMAEINAAYESIKKGTYSSSSSSNSYNSSFSAQLQTIHNYIQAGHFYEALGMLNQVPSRNAQWYYLAGLAYSGLGNPMNALQCLQQACAMDPGNQEYRMEYERVRNGQGSYSQQFGFYSPFTNQGFVQRRFSFGKWILQMIMLNLLCNCCCRGGFLMGPYYF